MPKTSNRTVEIIDTTLRDAQQCLWATRMTSAMINPIAQSMEDAGFAMIDFMAPVSFDVCVRYLGENPWEKTRHFRKIFRNTPLRGYCRSKSLVGFGMVPDDIVEMWIDRLHANGFGVVGTLDALFDIDNMLLSIKRAKKIGLKALGVLVFSESPVHTDELYARTAKALVEKGNVDGIMLKDSGALLTPDRIRTIVPALRAVIKGRPLELHGHCNTGLAPLVYMEAVKLGVEQLHTSIAPLASGPAQPATQLMLRNLEVEGFKTRVDRKKVDAISSYLTELAAREGFPLGAAMDYDSFHYKHQMPGGMMANWRYQLSTQGLEHRFEEILDEIVRIREELGWPIMVTPFSQILGVQAMLNVTGGERYRAVPDEVKMYALGHFGKLLAPVAPEILDRIVENGSPKIPLKPQPLPPGVPALRAQYPNADDDERLLRYMFAGNEVDKMMAAGPLKVTVPAASPVARLVEALAARPQIRYLEVQKKGARLTFASSARQ